MERTLHVVHSRLLRLRLKALAAVAVAALLLPIVLLSVSHLHPTASTAADAATAASAAEATRPAASRPPSTRSSPGSRPPPSSPSLLSSSSSTSPSSAPSLPASPLSGASMSSPPPSAPWSSPVPLDASSRSPGSSAPPEDAPASPPRSRLSGPSTSAALPLKVLRLLPTGPFSSGRTVRRDPPGCSPQAVVNAPEAPWAHVVSAGVMSEVAGPVVGVSLALPLWGYTVDVAYADSGLDVAIDAQVRVGGAVTARLAEAGRYIGRTAGSGHSEYLVRIPLTADLLAAASAAADVNADVRLVADLTVRLNDTVRTAANCTLTVAYAAAFRDLRVDLPIGVPDLDAFSRLVAAQRLRPVHSADVVACYGPVYQAGPDGCHLARYLVEHIEYNRVIGVQHMVYYVHGDVLGLAEVAAAVRLYEGAAFVTFVDFTDVTTQSPNHAQHFFINDCVRRVKSQFRFVFVGDIDEWLWCNRTLSGAAAAKRSVLRETLSVLLRDGLANSTRFHLEARDDLVTQPSVCDRLSGNDTLEAASERARSDPARARLQMAKSPYAVVTPDAPHWAQATAADGRTKTVFLSGLTECADIHFACGRHDNDPETTRLANFGLYKLHTRGLPFAAELTCTDWGDRWLQAEHDPTLGRLRVPLHATVDDPALLHRVFSKGAGLCHTKEYIHTMYGAARA